MIKSKIYETSKENLTRLTEELNLAHMKTQHDAQYIGDEVRSEREKYKNSQYAINGEYYYNREKQNIDFNKLKALYRKNVSNFFILNNSIKDIMYKWPERKLSIQEIIKEETDKLHLGGNNSYSNKSYRFFMDGETFNQQEKDNLYFRELDLPNRYNDNTDIDRDPLFEFPVSLPSSSPKFKI